MSSDLFRTRQERREARLRKKRERIIKHGRSLARIYRDSVIKKLKRVKRR
ncbi:MAG: hypothetical protein HYX96_07970 [Chloroflexi bacterium]|nr:hypothetical protein [Chloroflexota bacterium]